ncbi:DUF3010 family protein [Pokkaliibacter sp. CJK22405]|uniref:DUF3010 family protein n=1 Tax=Pokkaliibacter sp. CJK22405 TaxID=3384615 RepID=UPI00398562C8
MRVCGIELKGNEAVIALLERDRGLFHWLPCRANRVALKDVQSTEETRRFQFALAKLFEDYKVDQVAIISRPHKGKYAGEGSTFKMEAAIQLISGVEVGLISQAQIREHLERFPVDESDLGVKRFQKGAFLAGYVWLGQLPAGD